MSEPSQLDAAASGRLLHISFTTTAEGMPNIPIKDDLHVPCFFELQVEPKAPELFVALFKLQVFGVSPFTNFMSREISQNNLTGFSF